MLSRPAFLAGITTALVLFSVQATDASPWGAPYSHTEHSPPQATFLYYHLGEKYMNASDWARFNSIEADTDVYAPRVWSHDVSDVAVMDSHFKGDNRGYIAYHQCQDSFAWPHCAHGHVRFNTAYIKESTWQFRTFVACHEFGHVLGFTDYDVADETYRSCTNYHYLNQSVNRYGSHDINDHINLHY